VVALMAIALGTSLAAVWPQLGATSDFGDAIDRVREALSGMPAILVIAPARAVVAPLGAASLGEWLRVFPIAVAIWLLHVPWILLNRTPFEEAAVAAGERREAVRAAMRARRASGGRGIGALIAARAALGKKTWVARRTWLPLPPTGPAWMAITWKNFIPTIRQVRWATLAFAAVGVAAIGTMVSWISYQKTADLPQSILIARNTLAGVGAAIAILWTIVGPLYTRNDFRSDLPYLRLLRTFPLDSGSLVGAEIAASTALIFAFQLVCLVFALVLPGGERIPHFGQRVLIVLALLLALLTLDVLSVTVRNAVALFFPGWVKLGTESGGFEVIGQNLLGTVGSMLLLILLLVIPAALAGGVLYTIHALPTAINGRIVFALIAFVAAIAAELWFLFRWLGTIYDNIDAGEILDSA
jgi:ABC-2 type transport system permease protein